MAELQSNSGPSSGGQFQLVTKSGTNQFHGNINEYHRDPSLVANSWFSNNASPIVPRNHLIQNQFGGNVGGPVLKNKLFFFFDFNDSRIISSLLVQRTVPLDSFRAGNLGYINNAGGTSYLSPAQVTALDPAGIGTSSNLAAGVHRPLSAFQQQRHRRWRQLRRIQLQCSEQRLLNQLRHQDGLQPEPAYEPLGQVHHRS